MKIHTNISLEQASPETGIGQVVLAQHKYLPKLGIEIINTEQGADLLVSHIARNGLSHVDVLHSHGLYFQDVPHLPYSTGHYRINREIAAAAREALTITVPSSWVAKPFQRDMRLSPVILGHGINLKDWKPVKKRGGYALYNKNRESDVCTSEPAWQLAMQGVPVKSTFSPAGRTPPESMEITGTVAHPAMKKLIAEASVYLAVTLETFGIGTLEALACGVPVLGYDWGGTADIVIHQKNGYLVRPGEDLKPGWDYIQSHWAEMSEAAYELSRSYDWANIIQRYAELYQSAYQQLSKPHDATLIITNYNYSRWVGAAIESGLDQSIPFKEIIVVDDGSTDNSLQVIGKYNDRVRIISTPNRGVASARNTGISAATTEFITCLDADDMLDKYFVETLLPEIKADRALGIVYSGLTFIDDDGERQYSPSWPPQFDWSIQSNVSVPPSNTIPSACMFRREMWARAGGLRQEYAPGEDAEFWTRGLSIGFTAKRVTQQGLFLYRSHSGSASRSKQYVRIDDRMPWMRDKEFPMAAPVGNKTMNVVRSYWNPSVSIIIPVGPGHEHKLERAIESVIGQSFRDWELIVVDDSGKNIDLDKWPFAVKLHTYAPGAGAGAARNIGIKYSKAPYVLFLDADDTLWPTALEVLAQATDGEQRYIYGDWATLSNGKITVEQSGDFSRDEWRMFHPVTVLMPREWALDLLFDEEMTTWEDWDFFLRANIKGYCGKRVAIPILTYFVGDGIRRREAWDNGQIADAGKKALELLKNRYRIYFEGGKNMASCCGGQATNILVAKRQMGMVPTSEPVEGAKMERMEYTGENIGAISFTVNGHIYRGGNNVSNKYANVDPLDVEALERTGRWKRIVVPTPLKPAPPVQTEPAPSVSEVARTALMQAKQDFVEEEGPTVEEITAALEKQEPPKKRGRQKKE